jgi:hypothetical protein
MTSTLDNVRARRPDELRVPDDHDFVNQPAMGPDTNR